MRSIGTSMIALLVAFSTCLIGLPPSQGQSQAASPNAKQIGNLSLVQNALNAPVPITKLASNQVRHAHVQSQLIVSQQAIISNQKLTVGIVLKMDEHWHTYWQNPGASGLATSIDWKLPAGFVAGPIQWPYPQKIVRGGIVTYGYEKQVILLVDIQTPQKTPDKPITLVANLRYLACKEQCIPGRSTLSLTLATTAKTQAPLAHLVAASTHLAILKQARKKLAKPLASNQVHVTFEHGFLLEFETVKLSDTTATFFPYQSNMIDESASQQIQINRDKLGLKLQAASALKDSPPRLQGVLVIESTWPTRAYLIDAPVISQAERDGAESNQLTSADSSAGLLVALFYALLGGMILNLMPCVFPVLSIKILSFVKQSNQTPKTIRQHGYAFGFGVILSFWILTGVLIALRAGGEQLGWGFQLQDPRFVAVMAILMCAISLNLAGVFDVGMGLMSFAGKVDQSVEKTSLAGSFYSGILATLVATPCTAPLMGTAVGYALTLPASQTLLIFTALGVGMAGPYVVLSIFPSWLSWLPRPGAWMESFKQLMAFPMFATTLWLTWVFGHQVGGVNGMLALLLSLLALSLGLWLFGRWNKPTKSHLSRHLARWGSATFVLIALFIPVKAVSIFSNSASTQPWLKYSRSQVETFEAQGRIIFLDFTADWCLTCKVNEQTTLSSDKVSQVFKKYDVVLIKADWTRKDQAITQAMASFGRSSVPLYVVIGPGLTKPLVLPTLLTPQMVTTAVTQAARYVK